jgi:hypothetical protein
MQESHSDHGHLGQLASASIRPEHTSIIRIEGLIWRGTIEQVRVGMTKLQLVCYSRRQIDCELVHQLGLNRECDNCL